MNTTKIEYEEAKRRAMISWFSLEPRDIKDYKCKYCFDTKVIYRDGFGGHIDCKECK